MKIYPLLEDRTGADLTGTNLTKTNKLCTFCTNVPYYSQRTQRIRYLTERTEFTEM